MENERVRHGDVFLPDEEILKTGLEILETYGEGYKRMAEFPSDEGDNSRTGEKMIRKFDEENFSWDGVEKHVYKDNEAVFRDVTKQILFENEGDLPV